MTFKNINVNNLVIPEVRVATGLYTHWDSVVKFNQDILEWIKRAYKEEPKGLVLKSIEEVAYTISEAVKNGGKEFLVTEDVYNRLNQFFLKRETRIGGNGFNMGNMLLLTGLTPVVSYPSRSKKLTEVSPKFDIVIGDKLEKPKKSTRLADPDYDHIIIELENSRQILSWDPIASQGLFDYEFLKYATNSDNIDLLLLSYAHMLLPEYKKKTDDIIEKLRDNRPKVHLEFGSGSKESMDYAMKKFSENKSCESWGMDEVECKTHLGAKSYEKDDMKEAVLNAIKEYNVDRICIHTPDFAFVVSKHEMAVEYRALITANLFAAARTFGKINLELAKQLPTTFEAEKEKIGEYNYCLVPCLINKFPKILTGIGDSFAAIQTVKALG